MPWDSSSEHLSTLLVGLWALDIGKSNTQELQEMLLRAISCNSWTILLLASTFNNMHLQQMYVACQSAGSRGVAERVC